MTTTKNPSEFYGLKYLKSPMGSRALMTDGIDTNRWEDSGLFYGAARVAAELGREHGAQTILDVGCGRGFVVRHLHRLGFKAHGCEYAPLEEVCPVVDQVSWGDLTETLPFDDEQFDLTLCLGVLSHIPEDLVVHALEELNRVTKKLLWTHILVIDHPLQKHHMTIKPPHWWADKFMEAELTAKPQAAEWLWARKMTLSPYSWPMLWSTDAQD